MRVELNEAAEIHAFTIFYRPLPGLATFAAALAPQSLESTDRPSHCSRGW
jgi:hypothetical protein